MKQCCTERRSTRRQPSMAHGRNSWWVAVAALGLACQGQADGSVEDDVPGAPSEANEPSEGSAQGGPEQVVNDGMESALESCAASPEAQLDWGAEQQLTDLIVGAWLFCPGYENDTTIAPEPGVVGIEFLDDMTYAELVRDESGSLVRGTGIDHVGAWQPGTDGMSPEVTLVIPLSDQSFSLYRPVFTDGPRQMRVEEGWSFFNSTRYVPIEPGR